MISGVLVGVIFLMGWMLLNVQKDIAQIKDKLALGELEKFSFIITLTLLLARKEIWIKHSKSKSCQVYEGKKLQPCSHIEHC